MEVVAEVKKLVDTQLNLEDEIARLQKETLLQEQSLKENILSLNAENKELRRNLTRLLKRFRNVQQGLTNLFGTESQSELVSRAHTRYNSSWIPDILERKIYESAVEEVSEIIDKILCESLESV